MDKKTGGGAYTGASFRNDVGKFMARCQNQITGEEEFLGYFDDPFEAHLAWKKRKYELARILVQGIEDQRVKEAILNRYKDETNE